MSLHANGNMRCILLLARLAQLPEITAQTLPRPYQHGSSWFVQPTGHFQDSPFAADVAHLGATNSS